MELRPYQQEAVAAVYDHLRSRDDHPCVVIPTAGGKTPVMATICRDAVRQWGGRVLILAHVKELLEQAYEKLNLMAPDLWDKIGIYSAGLKSRDRDKSIIIAGIQSVYRRAAELDRFDLILIDEAHMLPPEGEGMYRTFLEEAHVINPHVRLIGLTATPYRMSTGMICGPDNLLNHVCYEVGVRELILQGYLCKLISKAGKNKADTSGLHSRAGEFIADEVEALMDDEELVQSACSEIIEQTQNRSATLIFASGVKHAENVQRTIGQMGHECGFISGETSSDERALTLGRFKKGDLKYLVNVNVLTTGFDAPNIDCVALLRPTNSPGLLYQMCGRGFRLHPAKNDCLVLDFGGNIVRHGPIDALNIKERNPGKGDAPAKECPECQALIHAAYTTCPECGYVFPPPNRNQHDHKASTESILSGEISDSEHDVQEVYYSVHTKRGATDDQPKTMRVDYKIGFSRYVSEWVCFEHHGYAFEKAKLWWAARSNDPLPRSAQEAVDSCNSGGIAATRAITVRTISGEKFPRVIHHELGPIPPRLDGSDELDDGNLPEYLGPDDDELPF